VLSATPEKAERIRKLAQQAGAPVHVLGAVGGEKLEISAGGERQVSMAVAAMEQTWRGALQALIEQ